MKMCTVNAVCNRVKASWLYSINDVGAPCFEEVREKFNKQRYAACCDECRLEILYRYNKRKEIMP